MSDDQEKRVSRSSFFLSDILCRVPHRISSWEQADAASTQPRTKVRARPEQRPSPIAKQRERDGQIDRRRPRPTIHPSVWERPTLATSPPTFARAPTRTKQSLASSFGRCRRSCGFFRSMGSSSHVYPFILDGCGRVGARTGRQATGFAAQHVQ